MPDKNFIAHKNFLITDDEGNNIAVISKKGKASPFEFNEAIALAIKEHFCADEVNVIRVEDELTFTAITKEDEDENVRNFTMEQIAIY